MAKIARAKATVAGVDQRRKAEKQFGYLYNRENVEDNIRNNATNRSHTYKPENK